MRRIRAFAALGLPVCVPFCVLAVSVCAVGCGAGEINGEAEEDMAGGAGGDTSGTGGDSVDVGSGGTTSGGASGGGGASAGGPSTGGAGADGQAGMAGASAAGGAAGATGGAAGATMPSDTPPPDWKKTILAVGYGGMRVATQDQGATWKKVAQLTRGGGDDRELLRSVAFGKGRWVSAGWRMFTSVDGSTWVEGKNPDGCGLMEGAAFGNGVFVGTCGDNSYLSNDGLTWRKGGRVGATNGHTYVEFANGAFAASGDSGNSYTSTDGIVWTGMANLRKVTFCEGQWRSGDACAGDAWFPNAFYRGAWRGKLERSLNGSSWATTYTDDWNNSVYRFGEGFMPPLK